LKFIVISIQNSQKRGFLKNINKGSIGIGSGVRDQDARFVSRESRIFAPSIVVILQENETTGITNYRLEEYISNGLSSV